MNDVHPVRLGVVGLGMGAMLTLPTLRADPRVQIVGVFDPDETACAAFAADHSDSSKSVGAHASLGSLLSDPTVEAVYLASPHRFHAAQARAALSAGRHVLVEKPLALTVEECLEVAAVAEQHQRHVLVGHTHAFDPVAREIAAIVHSGRLGRLAMINTWNFSSFLYRPRHASELDTGAGGGIVFNQLPHQVDIVRLLGGGLVRSVRSATFRLDPARPTEGSHTTFLEFDDGAAATLVYSGNDYFDSDEWHDWVGELGEQRRQGDHGAWRRAIHTLAPGDEVATKQARRYGSVPVPTNPGAPRQPHFGVLVASCEGGDIRWGPDGPILYTESGVEHVPVKLATSWPDRTGVIDALYRAVRHDQSPRHDARWGAATMEVCCAVLRSAEGRCEIHLEHQVAWHR